MKVTSAGVPHEVETIVSPLLSRWSCLVPGWCQELRVKWSEPDGVERAANETWPEYRTAILHIYPAFLELGEQDRSEVIAHELAHIILSPVDAAWTSLLAATADDGTPLRTWAEEEYRRACEGVVTDMTAALVAMSDQPREEGTWWRPICWSR